MPVSESFFALLGVEPSLDRTFAPDDAQRGCSVVISDRLWRGPLHGDRAILRKSVLLGGRSCAVVGVVAPSFTFYPPTAQAWVLPTPDYSPPPDSIPVGVSASPRPGASISQARAELCTLHAALNRTDGLEPDFAPIVADLHGEFTFLAEARLRATLWILLAAVVFVLLIVCLNVGNLLLGQGFARQRELVMRVPVSAIYTSRQTVSMGF